MYAAGGHGWFDALAVHPYQDPPTAAPDTACDNRIYRFTCLPAVRDQMVRNGDSAKPIWLTEFGWTTAQTGDRLGVDEPTQAAYLTQSLGLLRDYAPYVTNAFWYTMRDRDDWTPYENDFGLLHVDGSEKPAFAALQQFNGVATSSTSSGSASPDAAKSDAASPNAAKSDTAKSGAATSTQTLTAAPSDSAPAPSTQAGKPQEPRPAIPTDK